jgi:hypothetical protein
VNPREYFTLPEKILQWMHEQGLDGFPELIRVVIKTALRAKQEAHLDATNYEETAERQRITAGWERNVIGTGVGGDYPRRWIICSLAKRHWQQPRANGTTRHLAPLHEMCG